MDLSIIIPVYKTAATLNRCVESVLSQADGCEIILVDDGSPDECPQLCDQWARQQSEINVIHQTNAGLSAARNAGIRMAQANHITFVDSDDTLAPGTLPKLIQAIRTNPEADIIEYPIEVGYGSTRPRCVTFGNHTYTNWKQYWLRTQAYAHCYACNKVFDRRLFGHTLFPVGITFEDTHIYPHLLQQIHAIVTIDEGCYRYHTNPHGITMNATGADLSHLLQAHCHVLPLVSDSRYYAHIVNIALDVYHATGHTPKIPRMAYLGTPKLFINYLFGFKTLCRLHRMMRPHR